MNNHGERLESFINHMFSTKREFCKKIGLNENSLSKYSGTGEKSIFGKNYQAKLSELGLRLAWYLTGEGEMLIQNKGQRIEKLNSNLDTTSKAGVPYYEIDITASITESFSDINENPEFYINFKPFNDCSAYFPIYGDSMYPNYKSGEIIAVKKLNNHNVILWGETYFIITNSEANNLRTIKLLFPHLEDPNKVILRGSNPNYNYDTIVEKKDILNIYIVKGKISKNMI